jgi:TonB-linked SusC/RagA family outer membrane protein
MFKFFLSQHLKVLIGGLMLISSYGFGQSQAITGKVTSPNDQSPLPGINILVKNGTTGTTTNAEGFYQIPAGEDAILIFSAIGYISQEIPVKRRTQINVQLSDDTRQLNELVVVGYGTQKKRDITGSVSSLDSRDFNKGVQTSVDQLISGRSAGVQVTQASSEPGGGVSIRIRGANSINANNEPLYVIDGLPINNTSVVPGSTVVSETTPRNPLNALNPNDIESIEILKDASATAIYGSRGANGVILITTKKGTKGKLNVNYSISGGVSKVAKTVPMLDAKQYVSLLNDLRADQKLQPEFTSEQIAQIGEGTNWQKEIFRTGSVQNHQLSFSGGQDKFNYYASLNYLDQKGVVISSGIKKYVGRVNLNYTDDKFKFGLSLNASNVKDDFVPNGVSVNESAGIINTAIFQDPTLPIKNANGNWAQTQIVNLENPVGLAHEVSDFASSNRTFGSVFAEYFFLPELSAKINVGTDRQDSRRDIFTSRLTKRAEGTKGVANVLASNASNNLIEFTARYSKALNKNHQLEVLGGYTFQEFEVSSLSAGAQNFALDALLTDNLGAGSQTTFTLGSGRTKNQLLSYLGRVNYNLYDKYLLTASIRADGSSRFGDNQKYGIFPSVALGWRLKDEIFLKDFNTITDLKFRASYGLTGNQDIGSYKSLVLLGPLGQAIFDGAPYVGVSTTQLPNPDLKWETTSQLDVGVDFGLFENRLTGSIDYFQKQTKDLLLQLPIPRTTGFTSTFKNVGGLKNSGFELSLTSINIKSPFTWRSSANFSIVKNEVTDLGSLPFILGGSAGFTNDFTIIRKGDPLNAYYGYIVDGVFQQGQDIAGSAQPLSRPGEYIYRDVNQDGTINSADRTILGSPFPKFTYGLNNDFTFRSFNLSLFFQGSQGNKMFNLNRTESENPISFRRNRLEETYTDRWTPTNPTNHNSSGIPVAVAYTSNVNSRAVENASYLRLKTVQLTYNFPTARWKNIRGVQVYVTAQNLFTITKYTGFDPEVSAFGTSNVRADYNAFPLSRTFTAGLSINL